MVTNYKFCQLLALKYVLSSHKEKHTAHNNVPHHIVIQQASRRCVVVSMQFVRNTNRNTTLKAHPHAPVNLATQWQGYYHLGCPVCIKHALGTQKLTDVLWRIYKLNTGSKHSLAKLETLHFAQT
ncbi:hypothetical protein PROFUN_16415 [Planoprotostelium fungivorum]|uniref:Uncharacterized protein n=1 Tax=Planoprotostelium fungivorum TaxID=1890364 RepID=A0A2P6MQX3_9EUKA|nr:hypothetical protein PROFUN_16415 [Planoprotostelium fungivorum]